MAKPRFAYAHRIRQHGIEHGLQITGRGADDLEHVGGGGLLLQGFAQLVEQAGVLDRNHRLVGKTPYQLNLLVGERPHLLPVDDESADDVLVLEQRNTNNGTCAAMLGGWALLCTDLDIGELDHGLFPDHTSGHDVAAVVWPEGTT